MTGTDGGWPDRWQPVKSERTARPEVTLLGCGDRVSVTGPPGDPRCGQVGVVRKVMLDGGELVARVVFADGPGLYFVDELRRAKTG